MASQKRKPAGQKKSADIMRKATKLFLAKGFEATSTTDICSAAKLTRPSLYHYFESKNHLLFCVHMRAIEEILHPYMKRVTMIEEPEERLETMIRDFTKDICSHRELRFILHDSLTIKDKYFAQVRKEWRAFQLLLRDTIAELQSAGKLSSRLRPSWTALEMLGMMTWMTCWFDYKTKDRIDAIADSAVEMAFHGIGLDRSSQSAR